MGQQMWSRRVILRYALLQVPEVLLLFLILLLVSQWVNIPIWSVLAFTAILLVINIILYPFVWRAYDKGEPHTMSGSHGIASERLCPSGFVRINGELWQARVMQGNEPIEKGEHIIVNDIRGLTVIVQTENKTGDPVIDIPQ
jgi:membrane-bound ClpP family serine protease